jgi:hypothetical protein
VKLGIHGLPLRSAVIARRRLRLRVLAAITALSLAGFVAGVAYEIWPQRAEVIADVASVFTSPVPPALAPVTTQAPSRPVYRHSIVPGGAYSQDEVADAVRNDAVVAAHYQDIDVEKVRAKTVTAVRRVYVSYRVGDQVYWTKNRVRLSPGETLLTDGETEIRARCGNLLSDTAQQPVAAEEPPLAALDQPEPETGSSTFAGEREPEGVLAHVPFLSTPDGSSLTLSPADPSAGERPGLAAPLWMGGGGGGVSPFVGSSTGTSGTSLVAPLGGSERKNNGEPSGGGPNGGGSNGGGGGPTFVPPTDTPTTTGGTTTGGTTTGGTTTGGTTSTTGGGTTTTTGGTTETTGGTTTTTGEILTTTTGVVNVTTGGKDDVHTVPEPGTLVLLGMGACGLAARALRRNR